MMAMPLAGIALAQYAQRSWQTWPTLWTVDDALGLVCALVGALVASYLALSGWMLVLVAVARRGRAIPAALRACTPVAWQRVTSVALGLGLSSGLAVPAGAATTPPDVGWVDTAPAVEVAWDQTPAALALGWVDTAPSEPATTQPTQAAPSAPTTQPTPSARPAPTTPSASSADPAPASEVTPTYHVQPGDSLWRITADMLGDDAGTALIAHTWPYLYERNRDTIGEDPGLIRPGMELVLPDGFAS